MLPSPTGGVTLLPEEGRNAWEDYVYVYALWMPPQPWGSNAARQSGLLVCPRHVHEGKSRKSRGALFVTIVKRPCVDPGVVVGHPSTGAGRVSPTCATDWCRTAFVNRYQRASDALPPESVTSLAAL